MKQKNTVAIMMIWILSIFLLLVTIGQIVGMVFDIKDYYAIKLDVQSDEIQEARLAGQSFAILLKDLFLLCITGIPLWVCTSYLLRKYEIISSSTKVVSQNH